MVSIYVAEERDVPRVLAMGLVFMATRPFGSAHDGDPERLTAAIKICMTTGVVLLAVEGDKAFGMLCIYTMEHPLTGELIAEELAWWIDPEHKSLLAGPKLLRAGIVWARQIGVECLKMSALAGTRVGLFLEHQGFVQAETSYVLRF